jgi:hypothetical protein
MSSESFSVGLKDKKRAGITLSAREVDAGAQLVAGLASTLDLDEAMRLRWVVENYMHVDIVRNPLLQEEDR